MTHTLETPRDTRASVRPGALRRIRWQGTWRHGRPGQHRHGVAGGSVGPVQGSGQPRTRAPAVNWPRAPAPRNATFASGSERWPTRSTWSTTRQPRGTRCLPSTLRCWPRKRVRCFSGASTRNSSVCSAPFEKLLEHIRSGGGLHLEDYPRHHVRRDRPIHRRLVRKPADSSVAAACATRLSRSSQ